MKKYLIVIGFICMVLPARTQNTHEVDSLNRALKGSKPDTNQVSLQLKLGSYYLFKPGELKNDLDSAINFLNQAAQLSNKLHEVEWQYKTLALIGNYYVEAGNLERCKQCFMPVIAYYHQTGNKAAEAEAWHRLADLYNNNWKNDHQDERIGYYEHARSLYLQNHQLLDANMTLKSIAELQIARRRFDLAENELQQVLAQFKVLGYKKLQYTYDLLYAMELDKGNYYRAMAYGLEGIRSMKASGDTGLADHFYEEMARCNYAIKNYKDALEWMQKAKVTSGHPFDLKCKIVQILVLLNKTKEARAVLNELIREQPVYAQQLYRAFGLFYEKINQNDIAIQYYLQIFKHSDPKNYLSQDFPVICDIEIAGIYLKINQPEKAEKYLNNAAFIFKNAKTNIEPRFLLDFYHHLYKYHIATGNYKAAVKNLEQHNKLQDSLFTVDKNNKLADLNIGYQTAQKEQAIKDLHNDSAVQQARLEKANLQRNITVGGVVLLLIIAASVYIAYRHKQQTNLELLAKQQQINSQNIALQHLVTEKEWLLKEVHHRVKNNLHSVICLLETQAAYLENDALQAIVNSQHRIYTMSLIHQKLYQSDDIKTIDMEVYIPELVQYLRDSFDGSPRIHFQTTIDPIQLNPSQAIPLALIINEALTNAMKYAFPNSRRGEIAISLIDNGTGYKLEIADNGIGMNKKAAKPGKGSLGLELIMGLTKEIRGEIVIDSSNGVRIVIVFGRDLLHDIDQTEVDYLVSV